MHKKSDIYIYGQILFLLLSIVSCNQNSEKYNETIQLGLGEVDEISETDIEIGFIRVLEDSRCPIGAVCVWEGNGKVEVYTYKSGTDSILFGLNTTLDPKKVENRGYDIDLIELSPYPTIDQPFDTSEYRVTLKIQEIN